MFISSPLITSKQIFGGLSNIPNILPTILSNDPQFKNICKIQNIFYLGAHNVPDVLFGVGPIIFNTLNILVPLLIKKFKNHVQPNAIGFFECPFSTPLIFFVVILWFLVDIRIFVLFPILHCPWCGMDVYFLSTKLRSFPNQNITSI